jgi:hypothetical protein
VKSTAVHQCPVPQRRGRVIKEMREVPLHYSETKGTFGVGKPQSPTSRKMCQLQPHKALCMAYGPQQWDALWLACDLERSTLAK